MKKRLAASELEPPIMRALGDRLDLEAALRSLGRNDLLPPRHDDRVSGEVGRRFVEHLRKRLADGAYEPQPASIVRVPKAGLTSRPAALLTLIDRVVYEALVALLRPALGKYLLDPETLLWPREGRSPKRWREFESRPLRSEQQYVVEADIAGFYDSVDHGQLEDDLVLVSGDRAAAHETARFLSRIMAARRGLPQGLISSDALATTYLQPVDAALVHAGFDYCRHGDDIRVATPTLSRAREALAVLEDALRNRGLLLNSSKVAILTREQYQADLQAGEATIEAIKGNLIENRVQRMTTDPGALTEELERVEDAIGDQLGWDFFYHGKVSLGEVIAELRPHITPSEAELAAHALASTMERAPGQRDALKKEDFHFLLTRSLVKLAASDSPDGIQYAASIVARFPEQTELVCTYLEGLAPGHAEQVVGQVEDVLTSSLFTTPWQQAWLYRVLGRTAAQLSQQMVGLLTQVSETDASHWLVRVEAMKVLARVGALSQSLVARAWKIAPQAFKCDVLEAVAQMLEREDWPRRFLDAVRADPVDMVVATHVEAEVLAERRKATEQPPPEGEEPF